jgi:hypothetical protein
MGCNGAAVGAPSRSPKKQTADGVGICALKAGVVDAVAPAQLRSNTGMPGKPQPRPPTSRCAIMPARKNGICGRGAVEVGPFSNSPTICYRVCLTVSLGGYVEASGYLYTIAAVGMSFAGLSVLTMILRQMLGGQMTKFDSFVARTWVQLGFMVTFGSILPPLLGLVEVSTPMVWRISSALMAP